MDSTVHARLQARKPGLLGRRSERTNVTDVRSNAHRAILSLASSLAIAGCVPDLGGWAIGAPGVPGVDAGPVGTPNPLDLGAPCTNPHLLIATRGSSNARLLRWDIGAGSYCREASVLEDARAYGPNIWDVDHHAEVGDILGLGNATLALDGEGFPGWRDQPFDDSSFAAGWVIGLGSGASLRVGAFWNERSTSSLEYGRLVDADGFVTNERFDLPFSAGGLVAAHPSGDGRILLAFGGGPIRAFTVNDSTTALRDTDAVELFPGMTPTFSDMHGSRRHMDSDLSTRRLAMTHQNGVLVWTEGSGPPTDLFTCAMCTDFGPAVAGPNDDVFAICDGSASEDHLVHVRRGGACDILIDGSSILPHSLQDIALVRESR